ncbi:hypothetical protein SEA_PENGUINLOVER67_85 [Mycobacterium phage PenguinLover67]|nr:hypothetical protein SEA_PENGUINLOVER67_85 [Mycobacterium phage PenguinLover67]
MSAQARRRCPGSGRVPAPPRSWRLASGGLRESEKVTCPICHRQLAPRADGRVRAHQAKQGQRLRLVTQK